MKPSTKRTGKLQSCCTEVFKDHHKGTSDTLFSFSLKQKRAYKDFKKLREITANFLMEGG